MDRQERERAVREVHDSLVAGGRSRGVDRRTWERPTAEKTAQDITDELLVSMLSKVPYVHAFAKLSHSVEGINAAMDLMGIPQPRKRMSDPVDCYWITM